ncbi:hypothetical protein ACHAWF_010271 [Thalassiosira exigua]
MKPLSASSVASFALFGTATAVSSAADAASKARLVFDEQVREGSDRAASSAVGGDHVVMDVLASHPRLTLGTKVCQSEGEVLGKCLANNGASKAEQVNCAMCFMTTLDAKHESCAVLEQHNWCAEIEQCRNSKCKSECAVEFLGGANCILAVGCSGYQCSKSTISPAYRTGASGVVVAVVAIGVGFIRLL